MYENTIENAGPGTYGPFNLPQPLPGRMAFQAVGAFSTGSVKIQSSSNGTTWTDLGTLNTTTGYIIINPNSNDTQYRYVVLSPATNVYATLISIPDRPTITSNFTPASGVTTDQPFWVDGGDYHIQLTMDGSGNFNLLPYRWSTPASSIGGSPIGAKTAITTLDLHNITLAPGYYRPSGLTALRNYALTLSPELPTVPVGYIAPAVHNDGTVWGKLASLSQANGPTFTYSGWFKIPTNDGNPHFLWQMDPAGAGDYILFDSTGALSFYFANAASSIVFFADGVAGAIPFDNNWHHILVAVSTNMAAGLKQGIILVDGVTKTGALHDTGAAFSIGWTGKECDWPGPGGSFAFMVGDCSDVGVWTTQFYTDPSLFRDAATHKPIDPALWPSQPKWLFSGSPANWFSNAGGTATAMTKQAGTLTVASTSPSS